MRIYADNMKDGMLVIPKLGAYKSQVGIIVTHELRREHSYLDQELWLLILFGKDVHWQLGYECCTVDEEYNATN
jgi:hypothetical protein